MLVLGNAPDVFFAGNQPVYTNQPDVVRVDATQPASATWPGPNIEAPTNVSSPTNPAFVGNQPVNYEPPQYVKINDVEPPTLNWPEPPNYPADPPPENPG